MNIYLLRHGRTRYNAEHRYQGRSDIPLSAEGEAELCRAELTPEKILDIMSEQKANQKDRVRIEVSQLRKYFPRNYTAHQMEQSILKLLEEQYRKKQRSKDAR